MRCVGFIHKLLKCSMASSGFTVLNAPLLRCLVIHCNTNQQQVQKCDCEHMSRRRYAPACCHRTIKTSSSGFQSTELLAHRHVYASMHIVARTISLRTHCSSPAHHKPRHARQDRGRESSFVWPPSRRLELRSGKQGQGRSGRAELALGSFPSAAR